MTVDDSLGAVSITGMNFSVDGYMLTGDALSLVDRGGNSPTIEVGDGGTGGAGYKVIINNVLIGADGLTKAGAGTLTLTGSNTYTGQTDIKGGKLSLAGNGSIAGSNSVVIDGVGTLDVSGTTNGASVKELGGSGAIVLGDENLEVSGDSSFEGVISGSGGLTVSSGFLTLVGANTYTGLTTVDRGAQLQLGSVYTGSVAGDILNHGTLSFFFDDADLTYGGVISGDGGFEKEGTGTLTLTGANTFFGGMLVIGDTGGGALAVSSDANLGAPGSAVTLEGGTLEATAPFTLMHPLVLLSAPTPLPGTVQVDSGAALTVANGIAGGSSDSLIKTGPGTLLLAGMNGYGGSTTISEGTLALSSAGSLVHSSGIRADGTFDISGTTGGSTIQSLSGSGAVKLGTQTLTLGNASDEFSGVITGGGALTLSGGSETLSGGNIYSGGTTINAGTLQIGNGGTTGSITGNVTDDGSLVFNRSDAVTFDGAISGSGSLTQAGTGTVTLTALGYLGKITINDGSTLAVADVGGGAATLGEVVDNGTFDTSGSNGFVTAHSLSGNGVVKLGTLGLTLDDAAGHFSGVISGGGIELFNADAATAGTETLSGINTYSGRTDIVNGTLVLMGGGSIADSGVVDVGGTLDISGTNDGARIKNLIGNGSVLLGGQTLTITDETNLFGGEFGGSISGAGGVTLSGGSLRLTGANTYTGLTMIDAGATLQLGDGNAVGAIDGSVVGDVVDNGSFVFNHWADATYDGVISGTGYVTQEGHGTLTLRGANTFSGGVNIDSGTLSIASNGNLGGADGTLTMSFGTLETTASFNLGRNVALQADSAFEPDSGSDLSIAGLITGNGMLIMKGAGTLILSGVNMYSGGTTINAGTLQASRSLPGDVTVNGGTLDAAAGVAGNLSNAAKVAVHGGDTTVGGSYTQASTGTLAVSLGSKLAVNGTATLNGGTLEVTGADSGYVANTHTDVLTATGGVTGTFANLVKDTGVVFTSTTIGYGTNDVWLDTTGLSITVAAADMGIVDPASASAAQRVQTGFESINATMASGGTPSSNALRGAGAIQHSATPAAAQATLQSLSGQFHAASAAMLFSGMDAGNHALSEHFDDLASGRAKSGVWYSNLGWEGNLQRSGYAGASFRSGGGMAGADLRIGTHGLLGVAAGQSSGYGQLDAAWDHDRTWMNTIAMYGGVVNGPWYASAQVASGWYREDMQRLLQLGALMAPVGNASTGRYMAGALEGGRVFHIGGMRIVPFADVRYQSLDLGGFAEQGGLGYGLKAEAHTIGRLQTGLGLRAERGWRLANGMQVAFDGSAGWQHTLHQYGDVFNASFTGFNDWLPVEGIGLSRNTTILRAGVSLWPTSSFGLRLGYMREQDQQERAGSAMLQGTVTF